MSLPPQRILRIDKPFRRTLFILAICAICNAPLCARPDDQRIEAIKRIATHINDQISESEKIEESNGIYCNELVLNAKNKSWPAVGIYRSVIRMYYTFGDRERNPYPHRLLKITVTTHRSDRQEYAEYIFNPAEKLIFYFEKLDDSPAGERRLYFNASRLIRHTKGEQNISVTSPSSIEAVRGALREQRKLQQIFLNSLGE